MCSNIERFRDGSDFDFHDFRRKLVRRLHPSKLSQLIEQFKDIGLECIGERGSEAKPLLVKDATGTNKLVFYSGKAIYDPEESLGLKLNITLLENTNGINAFVQSGLGKLSLPEQWLRLSTLHNNLKIMHEVGHIAVFASDPIRAKAFDDLKIKLRLTEYLLQVGEQSVMTLIDEIIDWYKSGFYANMGITDFDTLRNDIHSLCKELASIHKTNPSSFIRMYREIQFALYVENIKQERDAWAVALKEHQKAKQRGVNLDNRPADEIFLMIDESIATYIKPHYTLAIKRRKSRRTLGLPD
jgi:hypothetical protein